MSGQWVGGRFSTPYIFRCYGSFKFGNHGFEAVTEALDFGVGQLWVDNNGYFVGAHHSVPFCSSRRVFGSWYLVILMSEGSRIVTQLES
jgi:hypothetical protein